MLHEPSDWFKNELKHTHLYAKVPKQYAVRIIFSVLHINILAKSAWMWRGCRRNVHEVHQRVQISVQRQTSDKLRFARTVNAVLGETRIDLTLDWAQICSPMAQTPTEMSHRHIRRSLYVDNLRWNWIFPNARCGISCNYVILSATRRALIIQTNTAPGAYNAHVPQAICAYQMTQQAGNYLFIIPRWFRTLTNDIVYWLFSSFVVLFASNCSNCITIKICITIADVICKCIIQYLDRIKSSSHSSHCER